jgi:hypothetical protein
MPNLNARPAGKLDDVEIFRLESDFLRVDVAPATGGRIVRIYNKPLGQEFLWKNARLSLTPARPGDPYDPNFYGGIDELLPGDLPEMVDGLPAPDHGELWTLPLAASVEDGTLALGGRLPVWGLGYHKRLSLRPDSPWLDVDYRIANRSGGRRVFAWKLHAALRIAPGDQILCPAQTAAVADPHWSRWKTEQPFAWPELDGQRADIIPPQDGTTDFLVLYDLQAGEMGLRRAGLGSQFRIHFDTAVFPYAYYFADYGGFDGHYTAVIEPCTAMPVSLAEATRLGQCAALENGEDLTTRISFYAGPE